MACSVSESFFTALGESGAGRGVLPSSPGERAGTALGVLDHVRKLSSPSPARLALQPPQGPSRERAF